MSWESNKACYYHARAAIIAATSRVEYNLVFSLLAWSDFKLWEYGFLGFPGWEPSNKVLSLGTFQYVRYIGGQKDSKNLQSYMTMKISILRSAISSPRKGEEKKNSCFQKYSESFCCVICYICILASSITFACFVPLYRASLNAGCNIRCKHRAILSHAGPLTHQSAFQHALTHQAPHLHLHSKSQVICVCSRVTGGHWSPLVDVSFCLKNDSWRGRVHFWILKVGKHDRFAETLVKISDSQCQSM